MRRRSQTPIGVVLAGGRGLRMGGPKHSLLLRGRPLIAYPVDALKAVVTDVAIMAKADVELPPLPGAMVWIEPDEPCTPLFGLVEALALAGGHPVLICPADMPFVTPSLLVRLSQTAPSGAPAVIASCQGEAQPLLGCYQPEAARLLAPWARAREADLAAAVGSLSPRLVDVADPVELFNIDSPEDLLIAAGIMAQPKVKS